MFFRIRTEERAYESFTDKVQGRRRFSYKDVGNSSQTF
ncbi:hypothetical protein LEP1GSC062_1230 [Leptospira alexanderi serovar Manhao 3 str. L 60]|uniref:Uncharacterized protein n=1 Tax=Leptospira alexanderi serovar Manhao 3 str. L 60 TaxID=1049759 RepID=V6I7Z4_9LEPT|nr:hypothetical protein LEP1GSC062_1230 [Leptospira alexanderi serovar Manhao 3 str. L 60]